MKTCYILTLYYARLLCEQFTSRVTSYYIIINRVVCLSADSAKSSTDIGQKHCESHCPRVYLVLTQVSILIVNSYLEIKIKDRFEKSFIKELLILRNTIQVFTLICSGLMLYIIHNMQVRIAYFRYYSQKNPQICMCVLFCMYVATLFPLFYANCLKPFAQQYFVS